MAKPDGGNEQHPDLPAWEMLNDLAITAHGTAIRVILEVLRLGPSREQVEVLAAGPFEDVLVNMSEPWGHEGRDDIIRLIRVLGRLVWTGRMPDENRFWFEAMLRQS